MLIPLPLNSFTKSKSRAVSFSVREEVGSSRISSLQLSETDFAISMICCSETVSSLTSALLGNWR